MVEHFHGKEKVSGSIPDNGSSNLRIKILDLRITKSRIMDKEMLKKRTKEFALRIIKLIDALPDTMAGQTIGKQVIRSGTSVAANYRAVCRARSRPEFISKLGVVVEEADETVFWLEIIIESNLLKKELVTALLKEANEITAIMVSARMTSIRTNKS